MMLGHVKELIDFGDFDPILKTYRMSLNAEKNGLSAPYLILNLIGDFDQNIIFR